MMLCQCHSDFQIIRDVAAIDMRSLHRTSLDHRLQHAASASEAAVVRKIFKIQISESQPPFLSSSQ
jgi:hypothetical protein